MKTLSLMVDVSEVKVPKGEEDVTPQQATYNVIKHIMLKYAGQNKEFNLEERRLYMNVCNAFDKVLKPGENGTSLPGIIELEDEHANFIKKCREGVRMMPDNITFEVELAIEEMVK